MRATIVHHSKSCKRSGKEVDESEKVKSYIELQAKVVQKTIYCRSSLSRLAIGMLSLGAELQVPALAPPAECTGMGSI